MKEAQERARGCAPVGQCDSPSGLDDVQLPTLWDKLRLSLVGNASIDQVHPEHEETELRKDPVAGAEACSCLANGVPQSRAMDKTPSFAKPPFTGSLM